MATKRNSNKYTIGNISIDVPKESLDNLNEVKDLVEDINNYIARINNTSISISQKDKYDNLMSKSKEQLKSIGDNDKDLQKLVDLILKTIDNGKSANSNSADTINKLDSITSQLSQIQNKIENEDNIGPRKITKDSIKGNLGGSWMDYLYNKKYTDEYYDTKYNNILKELKDNPDNKNLSKEELEQKAKENTDKKFANAVAGYSTSGKILNEAAKALKSVVDSFFKLWIDGINKQSSIYENTFSGISVRTGISRGDYYSAQRGLNNELYNQGLRSNIASSDVQSMWSKLIEGGLDWDTARTNAIDTVLTQQIVPYLKNIDSVSTQQLAQLQSGFLKELRGIGTSTMQILDSNVVATNYLNEMIDKLSPVARLATQDLGRQFAKSTGTYEALRKQGMTDYEISQYMGSVEAMYNDPLSKLKNGNIDQKVAIANGIANGIDFKDFSQLNSTFLNSYNMWEQVSAGMQGNMSPIYGGMLGLSIGPQATTGMIENGYNYTDANRIGKIIADNVNNASEKATNSYAQGKNQTNSQIQEITMENLSNEFATLKEWMGHYYEPIRDGVKAILGILVSKAYLNGMAKLLGVSADGAASASASSGIAGLLGTGGAIAAGITGGVAIGVAATKGILDGLKAISDKQTEKINESSIDKGEKNKAQSFGNSTVQSSIEQMKTMGTTNNNFINNVTSGYDEAGLFGVGKWFGWGNSYAAKEKQAWKIQDWKNYNIYKPLSKGINSKGGGDATTRMALAIAYALALRKVGYLQDGVMSSIFGNGININNDHDLYELIAGSYKNLGVGLSNVKGAASVIKSDIGAPYDSNGNEWDGSVTDQLADLIKTQKANESDEINENVTEFNSHRAGLDRVPYDNYQATLHKDEAVLSASTANEVRTLAASYQKTQNESISVQSIIEAQTVSLVNKMDEIIRTINLNSNISTTNTNRSKNNIIGKNMLAIQSVKSF